MKKSIVRKHRLLTAGFGILMGCIFPVYASFFVIFKNQLMFWLFAGGCLLAGIAVGLVAHFITQISVLRVVKKVTKRINVFLENGSAFEGEISLESDDELGELVLAINDFLSKLQGIARVIEKNIDETIAASEELSQLTRKNLDVYKLILEKVGSVSSIAQAEIENFGTMESAFQILNQSIVIVVTNILNLYAELDSLTHVMINQSDIIDHMVKEVSDISRYIGNDKTDADSLKNFGSILVMNIDRITGDIQNNLSLLVNNIGAIGEISEKTNVLSINTSIEAARAGKWGKGFKIIATEIRSLAEKTDYLTRDLKESIGSMNQEIGGSAVTVKESKEHFEEILQGTNRSVTGMHQLSGKMKSITTQINEEYKGIENILRDVKIKIENLKTHSKNVENFIISLKIDMDHIKEGMKIVETEGDSLYEVVDHTQQISNKVFNSMKSTKKQIQPFLKKE